MRARHLLAFILALGLRAAHAQAWQVFNSANAGLPSNTVMDVVIAQDGTVWAATDWGLWRYQAGEWEVFQADNSGLPENTLRCLAIGPDDRLWIGTTLHGAVVYDGQDWEVIGTQNSPLPDDEVNTIHVDQQGWVWLGTVGGLACYTGSEWRIYNSSPSSYNGRILNGDHILSVASRGDGLYALGTLNGGFHFLTDTSVHFLTTFNSGYWDNTQKAVLFDAVSGDRWVATPSAGLLRQFGDWYGGTWFQFTTFNSGLPSNALVDLVQAADGSLWLATQTAGVARRSQAGAYTSFTAANSGLPVNEVNCLALAPDGALWVGLYDGGLARFDPAQALPEAAAPAGLTIAPTVNDGSFSALGVALGPAHWEVLDQAGRVLARGMAVAAADGGLRLERLSLPPGGYLLRAWQGGMPRIGRFMVH